MCVGPGTFERNAEVLTSGDGAHEAAHNRIHQSHGAYKDFTDTSLSAKVPPRKRRVAPHAAAR